MSENQPTPSGVAGYAPSDEQNIEEGAGLHEMEPTMEVPQTSIATIQDPSFDSLKQEHRADEQPFTVTMEDEEIDVVGSFDPDVGPSIAKFQDHFTLLIPSSTIRYRDSRSAARVLETTDAQFVLEETYDEKEHKTEVSIRRIHDTSEGVRFLRISYLIVTAFWTGFLFVFCLQVLLFLFLDLAIQAGATSKQEANWRRAIGAVLAFPGFVGGLSMALVIAGAYILDTWRGHYLIRNFTFKKLKSVTVEWIFFAFFLGLPLFVMCITLLVGKDNWWEVTLLFWFGCVAAFYVIFTVNVVWYEINSCWEVTLNRSKQENMPDINNWMELIRTSILSRQVRAYSGWQKSTYLAMGSIVDAEYTDQHSRRNMLGSTAKEHTSWFGKLTTWQKLQDWGLYERCVTKEERVYSIDDARDVRPYLTSHTWGLEKIFCRKKNSRYIAIVQGPGAITKGQLRSSFICSVVGSFLIFFIYFSFLVYLRLGAVFTTFMVAVGLIVAAPRYRSTYDLYKTTQELRIGSEASKDQGKQLRRTEEGEIEAGAELVDRRTSENESGCVYFVKEVYRITKPTPRFCWMMFMLEVSLFLIYPLASLFAIKNYPLACMFIVVAGISAFRYYVNAAVVLEECGRMDLVDGKTPYKVWKAQSRLNEIVGNITRGRSLKAWMSVLGSVGFIFLALMLGAVGSSGESPSQQTSTQTQTQNQTQSPQAQSDVPVPRTFATGYQYVQKDSLRYPTCRLSNDLGVSPLVYMVDYAFLAGLAYQPPEVTQAELDSWFGYTEDDDGNQTSYAIDHEEEVQAWRTEQNTSSAVSFKLVSVNDFAYVLIRGTTNNWDMLTDAQLWSAAAMLQVLRELLPFGVMWTPIIDQLIKAITKIESSSIESVSFYKDTTAFVNYLKNDTQYIGVGVTGHSLGGGLSIITGAQTGIPAVALSGPNAMLSRRSFDPPISQEDLDSKTFNIIPSRDLVPMIDDVAQNWQGIRCQADFKNVIGCHSAARSLCEILYTCGSRGERPIPCMCVYEFGYSEPIPSTVSSSGNDTLSFAEQCGMA